MDNKTTSSTCLTDPERENIGGGSHLAAWPDGQGRRKLAGLVSSCGGKWLAASPQGRRGAERRADQKTETNDRGVSGLE